MESMTFWNDYSLGSNRRDDDRPRKKEIDVDFTNRYQLFNIIKKRREYKDWQPERNQRKKLIRALEELDRINNA